MQVHVLHVLSTLLLAAARAASFSAGCAEASGFAWADRHNNSTKIQKSFEKQLLNRFNFREVNLKRLNGVQGKRKANIETALKLRLSGIWRPGFRTSRNECALLRTERQAPLIHLNFYEAMLAAFWTYCRR
ncbi:MAG: hypothetical protein AAF737_03235 [Pseudomonadota bacterium]